MSPHFPLGVFIHHREENECGPAKWRNREDAFSCLTEAGQLRSLSHWVTPFPFTAKWVGSPVQLLVSLASSLLLDLIEGSNFTRTDDPPGGVQVGGLEWTG